MSKKKILLVILVIILVLTTNIVFTYAATKTELEQQNRDLQTKINQTETEISNIEEELTGIMSQIQVLTAQISEYEIEIEKLDVQIAELQASIVEAGKKLEEAEAKYNKQEDMLQKRIVALYEAGETTYLDMLLSSEGVIEFISNCYIMSEIAEYDTELLDQMEKNKNEIKIAKETLENSKKQIEIVKTNKEKTANALKDSKSTKQGYVSQLNDNEKALQDQLDEFEEDKKDIQRELAAIAASQSSNNTQYIPSTPNQSGYIFPVAGLNIYAINRRYYPSYPGHTGVDVNIGVVGKSVVAVKAGQVVTSTAYKNSDGTYRSYGECIIINHFDGTMTLYAHGLANTRRVNKGDWVEQGQVLMTVGSTGKSTGTHLHFEVRVNGYCVNPLPYLQ